MLAPLLSLLHALKVVLRLQLCNESVVGGNLRVGGKSLGYRRCSTPLFGLGSCHAADTSEAQRSSQLPAVIVVR